MPTANQEYFDASLRHQVALRRYSTWEVAQILAILEAADADITALLRSRLERLGTRPDTRASRLKALLADICSARIEAAKSAKDRLQIDLDELAATEYAAERDLILRFVPFEVDLVAVSMAQVREAATASTFLGLSLGDWFQRLTQADQTRLIAAVQLGVAQGETTDQIVRRVAGTRAQKYADGALAITRRDATAVVRTAVAHVAGRAREQVWQSNEDIVERLRWTSTLDGRTSPVCRARDGKLFPVDKGPRPPAHYQCRSVMVAVLDPEGLIGERPTVRDTRTRDKREVDFKAKAKEQAGSAWTTMSREERRAAVARVRSAWAKEVVGRQPAGTSYQEWLARQPQAFVVDVLGKRRSELFLSGKVTLSEFVDFRGRQIPLKQLGREYAQ